jgi:hypothetical protein
MKGKLINRALEIPHRATCGAAILWWGVNLRRFCFGEGSLAGLQKEEPPNQPGLGGIALKDRAKISLCVLVYMTAPWDSIGKNLILGLQISEIRLRDWLI